MKTKQVHGKNVKKKRGESKGAKGVAIGSFAAILGICIGLFFWIQNANQPPKNYSYTEVRTVRSTSQLKSASDDYNVGYEARTIKDNTPIPPTPNQYVATERETTSAATEGNSAEPSASGSEANVADDGNQEAGNNQEEQAQSETPVTNSSGSGSSGSATVVTGSTGGGTPARSGWGTSTTPSGTTNTSSGTSSTASASTGNSGSTSTSSGTTSRSSGTTSSYTNGTASSQYTGSTGTPQGNTSQQATPDDDPPATAEVPETTGPVNKNIRIEEQITEDGGRILLVTYDGDIPPTKDEIEAVLGYRVDRVVHEDGSVETAEQLVDESGFEIEETLEDFYIGQNFEMETIAGGEVPIPRAPAERPTQADRFSNIDYSMASVKIQGSLANGTAMLTLGIYGIPKIGVDHITWHLDRISGSSSLGPSETNRLGAYLVLSEDGQVNLYADVYLANGEVLRTNEKCIRIIEGYRQKMYDTAYASDQAELASLPERMEAYWASYVPPTEGN